MRRKSISRITIIPYAALALLSLSCFQPKTLAGEPAATPAIEPSEPREFRVQQNSVEQSQLSSNSSSVGFVYGQTLRFTVLNSNDGQQSGALLRVRIRLGDAHGAVLAQSAEVTVSAGEFHSFDFNRNDLPLRGEPGTGRLQVAWSVAAFTPGNSPRTFPLSMEVFDNTTGLSSGSQVRFVYEAKPLD